MDSPKPPERMADFFDARAHGYEQHMRTSVSEFDTFYHSIASLVSPTDQPVNILDVGCGTGLELAPILHRAPRARVIAIDLSRAMLSELKARFAHRLDQITLVRGSYMHIPFGEARYEYAVAVMTLHHLLPEPKRELYTRINRALKPGGVFIYGDWVVSPEEERRYRRRCEEMTPATQGCDDRCYHVDIPLAAELENELLLEAGFSSVEEAWRSPGTVVFAARE